MAGPQWADDLLGAEELWTAAAGSLAMAIVLLAVPRTGPGHRVPWAPVVLLAGLAAGTASGTTHRWDVVLVAAGVAVVAALRARRSLPPAPAAAASVLAAGALYACLPDTEVARVILGAVTVTGALAVALRRPWLVAAWTVTAALIAATLVDGRSRATAVVGGMAIALIHALVTLLPRARPRWPAWDLAVVAVALGVCSRVAGRGADTARGVAIAGACILAVAITSRRGASSTARARQDVGPPVRDD
jgi:hypothetical protein